MNRLAGGANHHGFHRADHRVHWVFALLALLLLILLFFGAAARTAAARPETICVATWGDDKEGDGSKERPFRTITRGLDVAVSGMTVHVFDGTYEETVALKAGVVLEGEGAGLTTIQGDGTGSVVTADGIGPGAQIDGFTITGGSAFRGGGIYCKDCSPTISRNTITGNTAHEKSIPGIGLLGGNGGGIYCESGSPAILDNDISGNVASGVGTPDDWGGGLCCAAFTGAVSGNTITNNSADWGGGLFVIGNSGAWTASGNTISGNSASTGAGVGLASTAGTMSANNITDNNAAWEGGGIYADDSVSTIVNNLVVANGSGGQGGGIYTDDSACTILNSSIIGNTASSGAGGIERDEYSAIAPTIFNCIIWGNGDDLANCSATYSDISSQDDTAGAGNISTNPMFVDSAAGNYRLSARSPCIDAGTNTGAPATDKGGTTRPQDGDDIPPAVTDMGAYEALYAPGQATIYVSVGGSDLTGDGTASNPLRTIGLGLSVAAAEDTVSVAPGTYNENIALKTGVVLQGAGSDETTIQGTGTGSVVTANGIGPGAKIDGFTITGGAAMQGGGIYLNSCSPAISHNNITGNRASGGAPCGGGIYSMFGSPPITDNVISNNSGDWGTYGGGIQVVWGAALIARNVVEGNTAYHGGGICAHYFSGTISGNSILDNHATPGYGGGVYLFYAGSSDFTVDGNTISDNDAWWGGGLTCFETSGTVSNNAITSNVAGGNVEMGAGGGISTYQCTPTIANNTIAGNIGLIGAGGGICRPLDAPEEPRILNCIIWGNGDDLANCSATYSDISSQDDTAGVGNISVDPEFADYGSGDIQLQAHSPCIDEATSTGAPATDFDRISRPQDGDNDGVSTPDVGAHERPYMAINGGSDCTSSTAVTVTSGFVGAAQIRFANESGSWCGWTGCTPSAPTTLTATDGTRTIQAEYAYGGGRTTVLSDTILLDRVRPTATVVTPVYSSSTSAMGPFWVGWSSADAAPSSGLVGSDVEFKRGLSGAWLRWKTETTLTGANCGGSAGNTYYFRTRALDEAGNVGSWSATRATIVPYDQTSAGLRGRWYLSRSAAYYRRTTRISQSRGAYARMRFRSARSVTLVITQRRTGGYANVYIGRRLARRISCYSLRNRYRVPVRVATYRRPTSSSVTVVVTHTRRSISRGYRVELDGIAIGR